MKVLVINPGSTSTKVSLFEDEKELFTRSFKHDAPLLLSYKTVNDQVQMRLDTILSALSENGYKIEDCDAIIGRGGSAHTQSSYLTIVDEALYHDTFNEVGGSDHPAKLGVMCAYVLSKEYDIPSFTINPTNMDELIDEARITGIKGLYRHAQAHALNQKAICALHRKKYNIPISQSSFICAHIDGGITVAAHKNGRMIDCNEGAGGDGPFTPTRIGSIPVLAICRYLEKGHTIQDLKSLCSRSGGFVSHFGTNDTDKILSLVKEGDERAKLVFNSMLYQTAKAIGEMAVVLNGKVDAILLTGGLVRKEEVVEYLTSHCSFIAPIYSYPGEVEMEAMSSAVFDYYKGKIKAIKYTGKDVFSSFPFDDVVY